jgi:hypothetical protein
MGDGPNEDETLTKSALDTMIKKAGDDVAVLMNWAHGSSAFEEKIKHISSAIEILEEIRDTIYLIKEGRH